LILKIKHSSPLLKKRGKVERGDESQPGLLLILNNWMLSVARF
jgi:hypothetical protein